jgi:DNA polymerase III epsilon subunit-like protein
MSTLETLSALVGPAVKKIVASRQFLQLPDNLVSAAQLSDAMLQIYTEEIRGAREQYLQKRFQRLEQINAERDLLAQQLRQTKKLNNRRIDKLSLENDELRRKIQTARNQIAVSDSKRERSRSRLQNNLESQHGALSDLQSFLSLAESHQHSLKTEVATLRTLLQKMTRAQRGVIEEAKLSVIENLDSFMEQTIAIRKREEAARLAKQKAELATVLEEINRLELTCESLLESVSEVSNLCRESKIRGRDLPRRLEEVRNFIAATLKVENDDRANALKAELLAEIPDIDIQDGIHISQSVGRYINDKVSVKARECQRLIEEGRAAERLLRRQLSEAVSRIQQLQSRTGATEYGSEFSERMSEWAQHKRKLDETMATLEVERTAAVSYLNSSASILDIED